MKVDLVEAEFVIPRGDARSVMVRVGIPGALRLHSGDCSLVQARAYYDARRAEPYVDYVIDESGFGTVQLSQRKRGRVHAKGRWDICISKSVPMEFELAQGIGDSDIQLDGVQVRKLSIANGIGDLEVGLGTAHLAGSTIELETGTGDVEFDASEAKFVGEASLTADTGTGDLEFRLPAGIGIRVDVSKGTGDLDVSGLERDGDVYVNAAWETAEDRLDIDVSAGTGDIEIHVVG